MDTGLTKSDRPSRGRGGIHTTQAVRLGWNGIPGILDGETT